MTELTVHVIGTPVAQGSKVPNRHAPGVRDSNAKTLKPWRADVAGVVADTMTAVGWTTLDGPIEVVLTFFHERPGGHFGTGRNAGVLKPSAPRWKSTAPDIDKLTRAILDSLTSARAIRDDARVARLVVEDLWADAATGARITVRPLDSTPAGSPVPAGADHTSDAPLQGEGTGPPTTVQDALL